MSWLIGPYGTSGESLVPQQSGERPISGRGGAPVTESSTAFCVSFRASAEVQDVFMTYTVYDDVITIKLIQEACKVLGKSKRLVWVFLSC